MKLLLALEVILLVAYIDAHGRLANPQGRASYWRTDEETYPYTEELEWCHQPESESTESRNVDCGVCGPIYDDDPTEPFYIFDEEWTELISFERLNPTYRNVQNSIQKTYKKGDTITAQLQIEVKHRGGAVQFRVASADGLTSTDPTQDDFNENLLKFTNGKTSMDLREAVVTGRGARKRFNFEVVLPPNLTCTHCVFQWYWLARDSQQSYLGCSDIRITA